MQDSFQLSIPTKIYFGTGITKKAITESSEFLTGNVLLVTLGHTIKTKGYVDAVIKDIENVSDGNVVLFDAISPNPKLHEAEAGIELGRFNNVTCIVAFGGGSAIDAAKTIAAGLGMCVRPEALFNGECTADNRTLPLIAIPTTAGTGSETSKAAIMTNAKTGRKNGIRGDALYPKAAIIDPVYTYNAPRKLTMETGFDVISHAVESYISKKAARFSSMLSEQAVSLAGNALLQLHIDCNDHKARADISYASMLMGINLGNTGTALPHRMQYPIGAITDSAHAAGLAALYPAWAEQGFEFSKERFQKIFSLLLGQNFNSKEEVLNGLRKFLKTLGIDYHLSTFGLTAADVSSLVAAVSGDITADPVLQEKDVVRKIYEKSL